MQSLYTQLIKLLGKPQEDPYFAQVIEEIGEKPVVNDRRNVCMYSFPLTGLEIIAQTEGGGTNKYLHAVIFWVDIPDVQNGFIKRYSGEFMAGIIPDDSIEEVRRKIELTQNAPTNWNADEVPILRYDFADHSLEFHFHEPNGKAMALASIIWKQAT